MSFTRASIESVLNEAFVKENKGTPAVNEEYVEIMNMPEVANALGVIHTEWSNWKNGPLTKREDIKPAQKELKGWIDRWFKQNIK